MRRFRQKVIGLVVLSLVFVQMTGVHYVQCFDRQEPTTTVIAETYVVSALFGGDASPQADDTDSPADVNFDLSIDKTGTKAAQFILHLIAVLAFAAISLVSLPRLKRLPVHRARSVLGLNPPFFIRPPPRAPPL